MIQRNSSDRAVSPPKPRPLKFNFINDDGREVTYRAYVSDRVSALMFALTVITASPREQEQQDEVLDFLGQMRAGFQIVAEKPSVMPTRSHGSIGFKPASEILIVPELVGDQKGSSPGVNFTVETKIGYVRNSPGGTYAVRDARGPIGLRRQKFTAAGGVPTTSTVHCTGGTIRVVHPYRKNPIAAPNARNLPEETYIVLRGIDNSGNYYFIDGNFNPVNGN